MFPSPNPPKTQANKINPDKVQYVIRDVYISEKRTEAYLTYDRFSSTLLCLSCSSSKCCTLVGNNSTQKLFWF